MTKLPCAWATTRDTLRGRLKKEKNHSKGDEDELTTDKLMEIIEGDTRLICISLHYKKPCI